MSSSKLKMQNEELKMQNGKAHARLTLVASTFPPHSNAKKLDLPFVHTARSILHFTFFIFHSSSYSFTMNSNGKHRKNSNSSPFCTVPEALAELRAGRFIILVDDEDRENEGDLVIAAEKCTPESITFMARKASGLICLSMTEESCDKLQLPLQTTTNTARFGTAFTITIEARKGVTTGISAADRARTIKVAIDPRTGPEDLARPGHISPLRAKNGGVLVRAGQTEGSVDLCRLAGLNAAAVICEIMNDDGSMSRLPQLERFARKHKLKICAIRDLIEHRRSTEKLIERVAEVNLPTRFGEFKLYCYQSSVGDKEEHHLAMTMGDIRPGRSEE